MAKKYPKIDWNTVEPGTWFSASIRGCPTIVGKIQKEENEIFLCQNFFDGNECDDKFEFENSWSIGTGHINYEKTFYNVSHLALHEHKPFIKENEVFSLNKSVACSAKKGHVVVFYSEPKKIKNKLIRDFWVQMKKNLEKHREKFN